MVIDCQYVRLWPWLYVCQMMVMVVSLSDDGHGCQSVRLWSCLLVCRMMVMVVSLSDDGHGC